MFPVLFRPDGSIPKGSKNAAADENVLMNNDTFQMYLWRLMDIAISTFEWKNLPEGVDPRMLEFWLLQNGFCIFFYDEDLKNSSESKAPEGYAVLQAMIAGQWDMYNYPKERRAYAVNGLNVELNETNSVLIFNDFLRVPMFPTLYLYAKRLAEIDRTIDVNVMNQKTPKIIRCDDRERLTFKNLAMQVQGNVYWIFGDKNVDIKNIEVLDVSAPLVANDLQILKHQYWNEALTFLGIENTNTDKKERLISSEVYTNMGDVEIQRFTRLNARKQACEEINKLFGLNIDCEFRSGIYIQTSDEMITPTEGMISDDSAPAENSSQNLLGRINRMIRA